MPAEPEGALPRQGIDLLPALGGGQLAERPAFARHFAGGPMRLARVESGRKEILFDREGPVTPADAQERNLWQRDVARLARHELYDLAADPHERHNLAAAGAAGQPLELLADLDPWLEGLRLMMADLAACREVAGELTLKGQELRVRPLFLAPEDRYTLDGAKLRFVLRGEALPKGLLVQGALEQVEALVATCDGQPLPALPGSGEVAAPYELRELLVPKGERALAAGERGLGLWLRRPPLVLGGGERDEETKKRLKALGYTG